MEKVRETTAAYALAYYWKQEGLSLTVSVP